MQLKVCPQFKYAMRLHKSFALGNTGHHSLVFGSLKICNFTL